MCKDEDENPNPPKKEEDEDENASRREAAQNSWADRGLKEISQAFASEKGKKCVPSVWWKVDDETNTKIWLKMDIKIGKEKKRQKKQNTKEILTWFKLDFWPPLGTTTHAFLKAEVKGDKNASVTFDQDLCDFNLLQVVRR